jgi:hypothetical protein
MPDRIDRVADTIGAAMITRRSPREIAKIVLRAAGHDPDENCTCHPDDLMHEGICEYRMLADKVGAALNPPDGDEAEVSLLMTAVEQAQEYIAAQPCTCTLEMVADWDACPRCRALGRRDDKPVQR